MRLTESSFEKLDKELRNQIVLLVARDYPWLAGEWFLIEGELGWGPGNRECEEDFPLPTPTSAHQALQFIRSLTEMEKDRLLIDMLEFARGMPIRVDSEWYTAKQRRQVQMLSRLLRVSVARRNGVINTLYSNIVATHSEYTIGAARLYFFLWMIQRRYDLAAAGLLWLLGSPLNRIVARAKAVRRRYHSRRKAVQKSEEVIEVEEQSVGVSE